MSDVLAEHFDKLKFGGYGLDAPTGSEIIRPATREEIAKVLDFDGIKSVVTSLFGAYIDHHLEVMSDIALNVTEFDGKLPGADPLVEYDDMQACDGS